VTELEGIWNCHGAVLTADNKAILAVGNNVGVKRMFGMLRKLDLDGNILSRKTYERRTFESFDDIVLTDDQGGFLIAEDSPKDLENNIGLDKGTVWLLRCDREGEVLGETSFPGRCPKICALGGQRYAVLYYSFSADFRLRVVGLDLKQQWEKNLGAVRSAGFGFDRPGLCPTGGSRFIIAEPTDTFTDSLRPGVEIAEWNRDGRRLFSASIPAVFPSIRHDIHVAYAADCAYVAVRTKGFLFRDGVESSIYRIPLQTAD